MKYTPLPPLPEAPKYSRQMKYTPLSPLPEAPKYSRQMKYTQMRRARLGHIWRFLCASWLGVLFALLSE